MERITEADSQKIIPILVKSVPKVEGLGVIIRNFITPHGVAVYKPRYIQSAVFHLINIVREGGPESKLHGKKEPVFEFVLHADPKWNDRGGHGIITAVEVPLIRLPFTGENSITQAKKAIGGIPDPGTV